MASPEEIAQKACVLVGIPPITSFTDGTTESDVLLNMYEELVESALSVHPWSFSTRLYDITPNRLEIAPLAVWDAAYQLPVDQGLMTVHTIYVDDLSVDYDRFDDDIYVNASATQTVVAKIGFRPHESKWPPYFTIFMIYRVAQVLATAVTRKEEIITEMARQEQIELNRGRSRDSQSRTAKKLNLKRFRNRRR